MKKLLSVGFALMLSVPGWGQMMRVQGTFAGTLSDPSATVFSASFSALFDSALVPATGNYQITNAALESLTITPGVLPGQTTTFTTSNAVVSFNFVTGALSQIDVGGTSGGAGGLNTFGDDFWFRYFQSGNITGAFVYTSFSPRAAPFMYSDSAPTVSISVTAVPEPATTAMLLGAVALGGAWFRGRNRAKVVRRS